VKQRWPRALTARQVGDLSMFRRILTRSKRNSRSSLPRVHAAEALERRMLLTGAPALRFEDGLEIATIEWNNQPVDMLAGRWMLKLGGYRGNLIDQQTRASVLLSKNNPRFTVVRHLGADGLFLVRAPKDMLVPDVGFEMSQVPGFLSIEPDLYGRVAQTVPNDPSFSTMWGLHNTGQSGGTVDADIDAPEAWDISTGSSEVVIGIADSGIDYNHPDLSENIWTNSLEVPGNGTDDDANGYIDDVRGWDFFFNDNDPSDDFFHGTHTAGTVGAVGNNSIGVTGVAWNVKLMALKIGTLDAISTSAAIAALNYVLAMHNRTNQPVNVRVTNHSWGGNGPISGLNDAIAAHAASGIMTVCAAMNTGTDNDLAPRYPASYEAPNIIAVGSLTRFNAKASDSNFGAVSVDLFAPGSEILSTVPSGAYGMSSGTSMATPHVAGVAALAFSVRPSATYQQVRDAIFAAVDAVPALGGLCVTGGRLNAYRTLSLLVGSASLNAGVLTLSGTQWDDELVLTRSSSNVVVHFNGHSAQFPLATVSSIVVNAGDGADAVGINGVPASKPVAVNGGNGDDTINFGNGDIEGIGSAVTLDGGTGSDTLNFLDEADTGDGDTYFLAGGTLSKLSPTGATTPVYSFIATESVVLQANHDDNVINVNAVAADVFDGMGVNGNGGSDTFNFGNGDIERIGSPVTLNGGAGSDTLNILDEDDTGDGDTYFLEEGLLSKLSPTGAMSPDYIFTSMRRVVLQANHDDNVINVDGAFAELMVDGNGGADAINIVGGQLTSPAIERSMGAQDWTVCILRRPSHSSSHRIWQV
jgi:subtilisin family serine protease